MEIKEMMMSDIEARKAEIKGMIDSADIETIEKLNEEVDSLNARALELTEEVEKRNAVIESLENGEVETRETLEKIENIVEDKEMVEVRNTQEYINAYANYVKTDSDKECRALLSENGQTGANYGVPVPELVDEIIRTAWNEEGIMSLVKKTYLKGNLKVGFEVSATGAVKHNEGVAVDEETLVLGCRNLVPASIKKWISISDEALDLSGEAFLRYIYSEVAHKIAEKCASELIADIKTCGTTATTTVPGVPKLTETTASVATVAKAEALLCGEAKDITLVMTRSTWASFKELQYANKFSVDPFEGARIVFTDTDNLSNYATASSGDAYMLVGDFGSGAQANMPNGNDITFKFDENTLAHQDLVRIIGRQFVGLGVVADKHFVKVVK